MTENPQIDRARLHSTMEALNELLAMHAGGLQLEDVSPDGGVLVRFTGMCTGCQLRPFTLKATIEKYLERVDGVTSVRAAGTRISDESAARLQRSLDDSGWVPLSLASPPAKSLPEHS